MNKQNFSLVYFLSRGLLLGTCYSTMFSLSGNDAIISILLGTMLGVLFIFLISKFKTDSKYFKTLMVVLCLILIFITILVLAHFVNSFFLILTPKSIIIIPTILLCYYASFKSMKTIKKTSFIFLFFSLFLFLFAIISMFNIFTIDNMLPLFIHKTSSVFQAALIYAVLSCVPNVLLCDEKINSKNHIIYYLFTSLVNIIICLFIIGVLKPSLIGIYSYPEYMILKSIKILQFVENIENIVASIWYFDLIFIITLSIKKIYQIIKNKLLLILFLIIISLIILIFIGSNYLYIIFIYHNITYLLLFILIMMIFCVRKKS